MLTPFGKALRKVRVDHGVRLLDIAEKTGKSVSFLSAVETGRKPIPDGFVVELSRALVLEASEVRALRAGADQTRKEIRVDNLRAEDRELVAAFARQLDEAPDDLKARWRKLVLKSADGEIPFRRKRRGMAVPPRSTAWLREFGDKIRNVFVDEAETCFPIMDVLEFRMQDVVEGFCLDVRNKDEMGSLEGMVIAGSTQLILREDVYSGAWRGEGRARFTATHEFAHFLLHRNVAMARVCDDKTKIYEDSEWQADTFAGLVLFSGRHAPNFRDSDEAAARCQISPLAARVIWNRHEKDGLTRR